MSARIFKHPVKSLAYTTRPVWSLDLSVSQKPKTRQEIPWYSDYIGSCLESKTLKARKRCSRWANVLRVHL